MIQRRMTVARIPPVITTVPAVIRPTPHPTLQREAQRGEGQQWPPHRAQGREPSRNCPHGWRQGGSRGWPRQAKSSPSPHMGSPTSDLCLSGPSSAATKGFAGRSLLEGQTGAGPKAALCSGSQAPCCVPPERGVPFSFLPQDTVCSLPWAPRTQRAPGTASHPLGGARGAVCGPRHGQHRGSG